MVRCVFFSLDARQYGIAAYGMLPAAVMDLLTVTLPLLYVRIVWGHFLLSSSSLYTAHIRDASIIFFFCLCIILRLVWNRFLFTLCI